MGCKCAHLHRGSIKILDIHQVSGGAPNILDIFYKEKIHFPLYNCSSL